MNGEGGPRGRDCEVTLWCPNWLGEPPMGWYQYLLAMAILGPQVLDMPRPRLPGMTPPKRRSLSIARHMIGSGPVCKNCNCGRKTT